MRPRWIPTKASFRIDPGNLLHMIISRFREISSKVKHYQMLLRPTFNLFIARSKIVVSPYCA